MRTSCFLVCMLLALSACNTIRGFGQDLQSGGQAIQGAAE